MSNRNLHSVDSPGPPASLPTSATGLDMLDGKVRDASWSAPLPKDILTIESLDKELDAAALGVAIAFSVLLKEPAVPGWLPVAIDEQRTPLCGLMSPIPSFCFTENHGVLPIRVVRCSNAAHQPSPKARRQPAHGFPRRHGRTPSSLPL